VRAILPRGASSQRSDGMYRKLFGLPLVALAVFALSAPAQRKEQAPEREAVPKHPHVVAALHELREARTELKESRDDFGGRRDRALAAVDDAIRSLNDIVKISGDEHKSPGRGADLCKA